MRSCHEVVAFEKNKIYGTKTFAAPPASDVISTYILETAGSGTKVTMQTEAVLMPAGMPSMPGMEDMIKKQMMTSYESTLSYAQKSHRRINFFQVNIPAKGSSAGMFYLN